LANHKINNNTIINSINFKKSKRKPKKPKSQPPNSDKNINQKLKKNGVQHLNNNAQQAFTKLSGQGSKKMKKKRSVKAQ